MQVDRCCDHLTWRRTSVRIFSSSNFNIGLPNTIETLSVLTVTFAGGPGLAGTRDSRVSLIWILLELIRVMEIVSGDNWSCKTCKAPVKLLTSTNLEHRATETVNHKTVIKLHAASWWVSLSLYFGRD